MRNLIFILLLAFPAGAQSPASQLYLRAMIAQSYTPTAAQIKGSMHLFNRMQVSHQDGTNTYYRVWDSVQAFYPQMGNTQAAQGVEAKSIGTNNYTWTGSPVISNGFFTPASGKYAGTGIAQNSLPRNSRHIGGAWSAASAATNVDCGTGSSPYDYLCVKYTAGAVLGAMVSSGVNVTYTNTVTAVNTYMAIRPTSDSIKFYQQAIYLGGIAAVTSSAPTSQM